MKDEKCPYVITPAIHFCQEEGEFVDCHQCPIYKERMKPKPIPFRWQKSEQEDDGDIPVEDTVFNYLPRYQRTRGGQLVDVSGGAPTFQTIVYTKNGQRVAVDYLVAPRKE